MIINTITILVALGLMCAGALLLYSGVNDYLVQNARLLRRLRTGRGVDTSAPPEERLVFDEGVLESAERHLAPSDPEKLSKIRKQLLHAGYRDPSAVRTFYAWKWGVSLAGLLFASLFFAMTMTRTSPVLPIAGTALVVFFSFFAADMWLIRKITYRRIDIERAFPDALDLLLVCIEAGHGLDQALNRVARELKNSAPVLSEELTLVVAELRAGKMRDNVLRDFAERTGVSDIAAFVTVIKQADQFGVSIADTLRVYSREMRDKRYMRAEEKANMMPIKLALGAIAFTIPPVILILIGPSVILIIREMAKASSVTIGIGQ